MVAILSQLFEGNASRAFLFVFGGGGAMLLLIAMISRERIHRALNVFCMGALLKEMPVQVGTWAHKRTHICQFVWYEFYRYEHV